MSCTASDLINIPPLALSDTFNTWFDRTNQLIQAANALNIYDIGLGETSGLILESGCSGSFYNGYALMSVNPGAGIGIGSGGFTANTDKVVIDAKLLEDLGTGASSNPAVDDYIIVSDVSDTRQGADGTPKRTVANRMLPPIVTFGDSGNGSFTIQGDVNIVGSLNVSDTVSYIDSNDLRIEDKVIELALNRYVEFVVEGSGFTAGTFLGGQTAYYHDTTAPTLATATSIGQVRGWSLGSATTGNIQLNAFTEGGVADFALSGRVVVTGSSVLSAMVVTSQPSISTDYFNDELLTPAGIEIKGLSGDKTFLWNYRTPDTLSTWNAFMANTNLGVTGASASVISSRFSSFGYGAGVDDTFTFEGDGNSYSKLVVGTALSMVHSPTGAAGTTFGIVNIGSTGATYPNVPVYAWVQRFNADQLDGAHALTTATAWSIPVSLTDGRVHEDFVRSDAIRKVFNVVGGHAFEAGDVVRIGSGGSLTFAQGDSAAKAEVVGIVETVHGTRISVVSEGYISGLNGTRINAVKSSGALVTGNVYYLSPTVAGGYISNPDEGVDALEIGEVRRAILLATDSDKGFVTAYAGTILGEATPTDFVYLPTVAPVGSISPYGGLTSSIPNGWLLCNGAVYNQNDQFDLFDVVANTFYAIGYSDSTTVFTIDGDTRGILAGDSLSVVWSGGNADVTVDSVDTGTREITITTSDLPSTPNTQLKIYGRTVAESVGRSIFFVPDLRGRSVFGTSFGTGLAGSGTITPALALAAMAGEATRTILQSNLPDHKHDLPNTFLVGSGLQSIKASSTTTTNGVNSTDLGSNGTPLDTMPPYVSMHYIIRSRKTLPAVIVTGHNHDNAYIRYDIPHTVGAGAANTLTQSDREQFRANAQALSKEGDDSTSGFLGVGNGLQVTGSVTVVDGGLDVQYGSRMGVQLTLTGPNGFEILGMATPSQHPQREWGEYPLRSNSPDFEFYSAQVRVLSEVPTIVLFSPTGSVGDEYKNENRGRISHYGSQHPTLTPEEGLLTASIGFSQRGAGALGADGVALNAALGEHEFRVGFNINGRSSGYVYSEDTALLISRKDTDLKGQGSIKYRLPLGLTAAKPSDNSLKSVVIDMNTGELKSTAHISSPNETGYNSIVALSWSYNAYSDGNGLTQGYRSEDEITLGPGKWMIHLVGQIHNTGDGSANDESIRFAVCKIVESSTSSPGNNVVLRCDRFNSEGFRSVRWRTTNNPTWTKLVASGPNAAQENMGFFGFAMRII